MNHSRQQTWNSKVLNDPKPYYKSKAQNKRRHVRTNTKGPINVWVPKDEEEKSNNKSSKIVVNYKIQQKKSLYFKS